MSNFIERGQGDRAQIVKDNITLNKLPQGLEIPDKLTWAGQDTLLCIKATTYPPSSDSSNDFNETNPQTPTSPASLKKSSITSKTENTPERKSTPKTSTSRRPNRDRTSESTAPETKSTSTISGKAASVNEPSSSLSNASPSVLPSVPVLSSRNGKHNSNRKTEWLIEPDKLSGDPLQLVEIFWETDRYGVRTENARLGNGEEMPALSYESLIKDRQRGRVDFEGNPVRRDSFPVLNRR
jgi:hypothetical protein